MSGGLARLLGIVALAALALPRCAVESEFQGVLGQPMRIDTGEGLPAIAVEVDGRVLGPVVLDVGSALTSLAIDGEAGAESEVVLRLLEEGAAGQADLVSRVVFPHAAVRALPGGVRLGEGAGFEADGVIGADVLEHFAVRFELARGRITLFDERPGSSAELARAESLAVFDYVPRGGGELGGSSCVEELPARRVVLAACLEDRAGGDARRADFALAVSTAVAPTVVAESSFARLRADPGECTPDRLNAPWGTFPGACRASIAALSLLSDADESDGPGPCADLLRTQPGARARAAAATVCGDADAAGCEEAAATAPVEVLVVPDEALTELRAEIGAAAPGVDGLVGTQVLSRFRFWADHPASRVILECREDACAHRPYLPAATR